MDAPSALDAAAATVVVVAAAATGLAVVGVVLGFTVVVVAAAGAAVVVVVGAVVDVVVVVLLDFFVAFDACLVGVLEPHAAAMRPPARTRVTTTHRVRPGRPDAMCATSGVIRADTVLLLS